MNKINDALEFIKNSSLPAAEPRSPSLKGLEGIDEPTLDKVFSQSKDQALVVGSDIVSFATGLSADIRESVTYCALLAQLVADKDVSTKNDIGKWYEVYFNALSQLGWAIQAKNFTEHGESGTEFEVNEAILAVAATVLGAAPTALAIVKTTLEALKKTSDGSSWIKLFNKQSQRAKAARFQVTVAEPGTHGAVISLMAFTMDAKNTVTQVLFFKFRENDVTLKHASGTVTLSLDLLTEIRPILAKKLKDHTVSWIESVGDLAAVVV